jgi:cholesterol transport system auxiliary component
MKRLIASLAALTMLSGCVSLFPEPEIPTGLYRLGPVEADSRFSITNSVMVRQPEAPRILSGVQMASRDDDNAIRLIRGVEWADRVPRLMQLTVLDYLGTNGAGAAILPETGARVDYELSWRLSEFSLQGNTALAVAELTLLDGRTRKPLRQMTVTSRQQATSRTAENRAQALAEAGRDLARQAAGFIAQTSDATG